MKFPRPLPITALAFMLALLAAGCQTRTHYAAEDGHLARTLGALHTPDSGMVLVAAHRGAHRHAPENSLAAIREAIAKGVDIVEVDVRETLDGELVLLHDDTLGRTTTGRGRVAEMTLAEVRDLRLEGHARYSPLVVPTLAEALEVAKGRIVLDLDAKVTSPEPLVRVVREADMLGEVLFFSSNLDLLKGIHAIAPEAKLMPRAQTAGDVAELCSVPGMEVLHIGREFYTQEVVDETHQREALLWVNALGKPDILAWFRGARAGYGELVEGGADVVQTDRPAMLIRYLRETGRRR